MRNLQFAKVSVVNIFILLLILLFDLSGSAYGAGVGGGVYGDRHRLDSVYSHQATSLSISTGTLYFGQTAGTVLSTGSTYIKADGLGNMYVCDDNNGCFTLGGFATSSLFQNLFSVTTVGATTSVDIELITADMYVDAGQKYILDRGTNTAWIDNDELYLMTSAGVTVLQLDSASATYAGEFNSASGTYGGGYGSTGISLAANGDIWTDGDIYVGGNNIYGDDITGSTLDIAANSADTYPKIEMAGDSNLKFYTNTGDSTYFYETTSAYEKHDQSGGYFLPDTVTDTGWLQSSQYLTTGTGTAFVCQALQAGGTCVEIDGSATGTDLLADNWYVNGTGEASFASATFGGGYGSSGTTINSDGDIYASNDIIADGAIFGSVTATSSTYATLTVTNQFYVDGHTDFDFTGATGWPNSYAVDMSDTSSSSSATFYIHGSSVGETSDGIYIEKEHGDAYGILIKNKTDGGAVGTGSAIRVLNEGGLGHALYVKNDVAAAGLRVDTTVDNAKGAIFYGGGAGTQFGTYYLTSGSGYKPIYIVHNTSTEPAIDVETEDSLGLHILSKTGNATSAVYLQSVVNQDTLQFDTQATPNVTKDMDGTDSNWSMTASGTLTIATGTVDHELDIGGGYGASGCTIEDDGELDCDGDITSDATVNGATFSGVTGTFTGTVSAATGSISDTLTVGGGYAGGSGITLEPDGDLKMNGKLTVDGDIDPVNISYSGTLNGGDANIQTANILIANIGTLNATGTTTNVDINYSGTLTGGDAALQTVNALAVNTAALASTGALTVTTDGSFGDDLYATGEFVFGSNVTAGTSAGWYDSAYAGHVVSAQNTGRGLMNINTYDGANAPATIKFQKNRLSGTIPQAAADDDNIGSIAFNGNSDTGATDKNYAQFTVDIDDADNAAFDGRMEFSVAVASSITEFMELDGTEGEINMSVPLDAATTSVSRLNVDNGSDIAHIYGEATTGGKLQIHGNQADYSYMNIEGNDDIELWSEDDIWLNPDNSSAYGQYINNMSTRIRGTGAGASGILFVDSAGTSNTTVDGILAYNTTTTGGDAIKSWVDSTVMSPTTTDGNAIAVYDGNASDYVWRAKANGDVYASGTLHLESDDSIDVAGKQAVVSSNTTKTERIEHGSGTANPNTTLTVTFDSAFSSTPNITVSPEATGSWTIPTCAIDAPTTTQFEARCSATGTILHWIAMEEN